MIEESRNITMKPDSREVAEVFMMWTVCEAPGDTRPGDSLPVSQQNMDWGLTEPLRNEPDFDLI